MEESFTTDGVGHDVDEYINNNISNDEVNNFKNLIYDFNLKIYDKKKYLAKFHL